MCIPYCFIYTMLMQSVQHLIEIHVQVTSSSRSTDPVSVLHWLSQSTSSLQTSAHARCNVIIHGRRHASAGTTQTTPALLSSCVWLCIAGCLDTAESCVLPTAMSPAVSPRGPATANTLTEELRLMTGLTMSYHSYSKFC